ncbi:hypothetical protein Gohar_002488 [Gossypium harknessii]|uniref:Uncharacterized protein n=1 Tax=Gossypium harknessii TaxID=34285 RepID=A0A7J9HL10_9ROSI|nr:hypothetical protein [Gossypium harknessii]
MGAVLILPEGFELAPPIVFGLR